MATLSSFLKQLADQAKIDTTQEGFKNLLDATESLELPENTDLLSPYILKTDALKDHAIKGHYYGAFANESDVRLFRTFAELGVAPEFIDQLKKDEPNSAKRLEGLAKNLSEHIKKIADPSTLKGEKAELQREIDNYKEQIRTITEVSENEKRQLVERNEANEINYFLKDVAREFKIIDSIPSDYRNLVLSQSISKSMQEHEVKPVLKDGKVMLVQLKDPSLPAKDGITFKGIIEKGFANDKLLDLGKPDEQKQQQATGGKTTTTTVTDPKASALSKNIAKMREMTTVAQ